MGAARVSTARGIRRLAPLVAAATLVAAMPTRGAVGQQVVLPPGLGAPAGAGPKPSPGYDMALAALAAGDYAAALELATAEYRGCTKIGAQRWIDTIAAAGLLAECHVELGNFREAVNAAEEALVHATLHHDWLLSVQFPAQPLRARAQDHVATWARSKRNVAPAQIPDVVAIRQQGADPQQVLQQGGVLKAAFDQPIRPQEIMRALVVATYRHGSLLGGLARESTALDGAARVLARRPAPANHYSHAWIDVALGTALWAQGRPEQAVPLLERGLRVGEGLDHPLAAWGLIVLGRIALDSDQAAKAASFFEEATITAADFGDVRALEEAFAWAHRAHGAAGTRGAAAAIRDAAAWAAAHPEVAVLRSRLAAMVAEAQAAAGDGRGSAAALADIDGRLLRGDPGRGALGAEAAYAAAVRGFAAGDVAAGDDDLARALAIARARSPALFQATRLVELLAAGTSISDRLADTLFARLLGPPAPRDFAIDPLATLALVTAPRAAAFDAWVGIAVRRAAEGINEGRLDPAEAGIRDRWLVAQPLGGRRLAAERLLAADPATLEPAEAARRAALVGGRPDLGRLLDGMARLRGTLSTAALAAGPADADVARRGPPGEPDDWTAYRGLAATRARYVAALAAGREGIAIDFPPLLPATEIRRRLADKQLVLSFHWTSFGLYGALESRDRFKVWEVRQAAGLPQEIAALARATCLFDANAAVPTDKLRDGDWRGPAARIERMLLENSGVALGEGIDELVIVPDGWLWYLPFELLPVSSGRGAPGDAGERRLRDACRVRYCPTRSLAVLRFPPAQAGGPIGIHTGRMARGDKPADAAAALERLTAAVDRAVPVVLAAGGPPPALVGSVFEALAIFEEAGQAGPAAAWPLVPPSAGRPGMTLGDWLEPPRKRPRLVALPGMQTAMAGGLAEKSLPPRPGDDVFMPATDLLAAGAQTALVSRWRVGGATCERLLTEFLRDQMVPAGSPPPASASWRRAVDLVTAEMPDTAFEPRIKQQGDAVLEDGRHPFLWAGYLLVDCGLGSHPPAPPAAAPPAAPQAAAAAAAPAVPAAAPPAGAAAP